jgi:hypothetical protein
MARVSPQFSADFELVTTTWIQRREHTKEEIDHLRQCLRVELSPGPGMPHPVVGGVRVKGWVPRDHAQRVQCYSDTFAGWADSMRRDAERSERIRAEMASAKESA